MVKAPSKTKLKPGTRKPASKERGKPSTKKSRKPEAALRRKPRRFSELVGHETYSVWLAMLQTLVPNGRTHRLAVVLAGMYHYATEKAERLPKRERGEGTLAASLVAADSTAAPDEVKAHIRDAVAGLFKDAGVAHERVSVGGEKYSVADASYAEYADWYNYAWD